MSYLIGVVGRGVVGEAVYVGMRDLGHNVCFHDIKFKDSELTNIIKSDIVFVCVPTPSTSSGACDTSIVESVVNEICDLGYDGIICIKSTVTPGTTDLLLEKNPANRICFVPEFLRERCALQDFKDNHDICFIGTNNQEVYEKIKSAHAHYPNEFKMLSTKEAEMSKYFNNVYNATLITFANSIYEICKKLDINYMNVKNAIVNRDHINDIYMDCNDELRGFGGMCLPKDTKNLAAIVRDLGIDVEFFKNIIEENDKYKTTVFKGMRIK